MKDASETWRWLPEKSCLQVAGSQRHDLKTVKTVKTVKQVIIALHALILMLVSHIKQALCAMQVKTALHPIPVKLLMTVDWNHDTNNNF